MTLPSPSIPLTKVADPSSIRAGGAPRRPTAGLGLFAESLSPIAFALLVIVTCHCLSTFAGEGSDNTYLEELKRLAVERTLADQREWHLLLHSRENLFGGSTSEQDDPGFFMAPNGKTDPQAELEATVARDRNRQILTARSRLRAPSWKVNVGMQTITHGGCRLCSNWVVNGGIGAATDMHLFRHEVLFAFAEVEGNYSRAYEERHRAGGGVSAGFYVDLAERWRLLATAGYLRYALGDRSDDVRWSVGQRYTLAQNWALRMDYHHRDHDNDVLFTVQAFF